MIERQTIVTWYTPKEKLPKEGEIVIVTISGCTKHVTYDHTFALAEWYSDGIGFELLSDTLDEYTVHAWCDLLPYGIKGGRTC